MEIRKGLTTDDGTLIPWLISQANLETIVAKENLTEVTSDYFVTRCSLLGGMKISLGFHFRGVKLTEFELFRHMGMSLCESYQEFQAHLETTFGIPTHSSEPDEQYGAGYRPHEWRFGRTKVRHYVLDRFGPEEHVRIGI